jgi:hypothetical protein
MSALRACRSLGHRAGSRTDGINETIVHEARRSPGRITRMQRFLAEPATMKAYLAQHCDSTVINTSDESYQTYLSVRYGLGIPADVDANVCVNTSYIQAFTACVPASNAAAMWQFVAACACRLRFSE